MFIRQVKKLHSSLEIVEKQCFGKIKNNYTVFRDKVYAWY